MFSVVRAALRFSRSFLDMRVFCCDFRRYVALYEWENVRWTPWNVRSSSRMFFTTEKVSQRCSELAGYSPLPFFCNRMGCSNITGKQNLAFPHVFWWIVYLMLDFVWRTDKGSKKKTFRANLPQPPSQCFLASKVYLIPVAWALKDGSIKLHMEHLSHVERFGISSTCRDAGGITWYCLKKGHHVNHQGVIFWNPDVNVETITV